MSRRTALHGLPSGRAEPARVRVEVVLRGATAAAMRATALVAVRCGGEGAPEKKLSVSVTRATPGVASFDVEAAGACAARASADGYWGGADPTPIDGTAPISLELVLAGTISGDIVMTERRAPPLEAVLLRLSPTAASNEPPRAAPIRVSCPVNASKFRCDVPAGTLDVSVRAPGYTTHFFWDVTVEARREKRLGRLIFRRGATLVGNVEVARGAQVDVRSAVVLLGPAAASRDDAARRERTASSKVAAQTTKPNRRGFFQLDGMASGGYVVRASAPGLLEARRRVTVVEGKESELVEPLRLAPPREIAVELRPALDPFGDPWRLMLLELGSAPGEPAEYPESAAEPDGTWRVRQAPADAQMAVVVRTSRRERWTTVPIDLSDESPTRVLDLPSAAIVGEVVDEEGRPVEWGAVDVEPSGSSRYVGVRIEAGTFRVDGLAAGRVSLRARMFRPREGQSRQETVEVGEDGETAVRLVVLADRMLRGTVLAPSGAPVSGAVVVATSRASGVLGSSSEALTDGKGEFEVGVPEGAIEACLAVLPPGFAFRVVSVALGDGERIPIPVGGASGNLVIRYARRDSKNPRHRVYVARGGCTFQTSILRGDGREATFLADGRRLAVLSGVEPGTYSLCVVEPAELPSALAGAMPGACRSGVVPAGGELALEVPE